MTFLSPCHKSKMIQYPKLNGEKLNKPFGQYTSKEQNKMTQFHYCTECGQATKPIEWIIN